MINFMKRIYQLKDLLDLVIWGSLIICGFVGLVVVFSWFDLHIVVLDKEISEFSIPLAALILLSLIGYVFFFLALFKLKKLLSHFIKKEFFSAETIFLLKSIGRYLLMAMVLFYVPIYGYTFLFKNSFSMKIEPISPHSFFFLLIIGLFFLILGYIFQEAKVLKEENELTV